jgi:DNA-binding response OmpR family regulator
MRERESGAPADYRRPNPDNFVVIASPLERERTMFEAHASEHGMRSASCADFASAGRAVAPRTALVVLRPFGAEEVTMGPAQCRELRSCCSGFFLYLCVTDAAEERAEAMRFGATATLSATATQAELVNNFDSLLRQATGAFDQLLAFESIEVNVVRREVLVDGAPCILSDDELALLAYLLRNIGRVITHVEVGQLLGCSPDVRKYFESLRRKLGRAGDLILTRRGSGYGIGLP